MQVDKLLEQFCILYRGNVNLNIISRKFRAVLLYQRTGVCGVFVVIQKRIVNATQLRGLDILVIRHISAVIVYFVILQINDIGY